MSSGQLADAPDIHVSSVMPASIDTPLFQHSANYTGRAAKALKPVYDAAQVAQAIVARAQDPVPEVFVGAAARLAAAQRAMSTAMYEQQIARQYREDQFSDAPAAPTDGNLFEPMQEYGSISGGWLAGRGQVAGQSINRALFSGGALLAGSLLGWLWLRARRA